MNRLPAATQQGNPKWPSARKITDFSFIIPVYRFKKNVINIYEAFMVYTCLYSRKISAKHGGLPVTQQQNPKWRAAHKITDFSFIIPIYKFKTKWSPFIILSWCIHLSIQEKSQNMDCRSGNNKILNGWQTINDRFLFYYSYINQHYCPLQLSWHFSIREISAFI